MKNSARGLLMLNRDPNFMNEIDTASAETCERDLRRCFGRYGGAITDIMLGVFEQTALLPNSSFMWRGDKYHQTEEDGIPTDHKSFVGKLYRCFAVHRIDAAEIFIEETTKSGIRPWFSLRMNDVHRMGVRFPTSPLRSDMFYEERDAGHLIGEEYGYNSCGYDFTFDRYKNAVRDYIKEIAEKYDVYGIELDFLREQVCFRYRSEGDHCRIMTDYIRSVRSILNACGKKLSVRVCRDIKTAKKLGFDVEAWCAEGLVDVIVTSPRWCPTDSAIPIGEWRRAVGNGVILCAGIETNNYKRTLNLARHTRAYAAAFYSLGADGIYLNNHEYPTERSREAWLCDRVSCLEGIREFTVTEQDVASPWDSRYAPLPMKIDGHGQLPIEVGPIKCGNRLTVTLEVDGEAPTVRLCGVEAGRATARDAIVTTDVDGATVVLTQYGVYTYTLSGISTDGFVDLEFFGSCTLHYVSLTVGE